MNNSIKEYLIEAEKKEREEAKEINPLFEYSTSQLKAELRRKKREGE